MNYATASSTQYFHVPGHEWPTLFVEMAEWLIETNACVEGITFFERIEDPEDYVAATIIHNSVYTKKLDNPFFSSDRDVLLDKLRNLVEVYGD